MGFLRKATVLVALALGAAAQENEAARVTESAWHPRHLEFALSDKSANLGFRIAAQDKLGFLGFSAVLNDDDDVGLGAEVVRMGEFEGLPVRLGVGIGAHAVFVDRPSANVYAISLAGLAEYDLRTQIPSAVSWKLAYAPDITTFDDGEALLETELRLRVDLTDSATAFVGFHLLQVDVGPSIEVDKRLQVGIRLGF